MAALVLIAMPFVFALDRWTRSHHIAVG